MSDIEKKDCFTMDQAQHELDVSKQTLYTYVNMLDIRRIKFAFDRKVYLTKADVARIRQFIEEKK